MRADRIATLVNHRSTRIDGPAFRGRPLGHRIDPLRSSLAAPDAEVWIEMVTRLLQAHDLREISRHYVGELTVIHGTIAQTMLWQSPAFAEYGYPESPDEVRSEPAPEQVFGEICVILDSAFDRTTFTDGEAEDLKTFLDVAADNGVSAMVFFRGRDLSGTGGLWRSTARESRLGGWDGAWHQLGLEALSYLVLTGTLVYLEFAPDLDWRHSNYLL